MNITKSYDVANISRREMWIIAIFTVIVEVFWVSYMYGNNPKAFTTFDPVHVIDLYLFGILLFGMVVALGTAVVYTMLKSQFNS